MTRLDFSQSEQAYRALEEQIVTLVIAPGQCVTEQELSAATGYGRTPVREAAKQLERDMLLQIFPRRGILIAPIDVPGAMMTLDVRARIEPLIMERAARFADEVDRMRFLQLADQMEATITAGAALAFTRLDRRFNDLSMVCARHEVAARVVRSMHAVWRRIGYYHSTLYPDCPDATAHVHVRLLRAIAANDQLTISTAMEELFETCKSIAIVIENDEIGRAASALDGRVALQPASDERKTAS